MHSYLFEIALRCVGLGKQGIQQTCMAREKFVLEFWRLGFARRVSCTSQAWEAGAQTETLEQLYATLPQGKGLVDVGGENSDRTRPQLADACADGKRILGAYYVGQLLLHAGKSVASGQVLRGWAVLEWTWTSSEGAGKHSRSATQGKASRRLLQSPVPVRHPQSPWRGCNVVAGSSRSVCLLLSLG